jgi:hypothetical protein
MDIKASLLSGLIEVYTVHPINHAKTLYQSGRPIKNIFPNVFKGVTIRAMGIVPIRVVFWNSMEYCNSNNYNGLLTATITGGIQSLLDYPIEQIKTRKMIENTKWFRSFSYPGVFSGFASTSARNIAFAYLFNEITKENELPDQIAGATGGLIAASLTQPLDVLKTHYHNNNTLKLPKLTLKNAFKGGLFRNLECLCAMSVGWTVYNFWKKNNF